MRTRVFKRKNQPADKFYGGSAWFSVTPACMQWMLKYVEDHPEYLEFFVHGLCMDELFFQTLAKMSPYAKNIENDSLRFMLWEGSTTGGPHELTKENVEACVQSKKFFARKFTSMDVILAVCETLSTE